MPRTTRTRATRTRTTRKGSEEGGRRAAPTRSRRASPVVEVPSIVEVRVPGARGGVETIARFRDGPLLQRKAMEWSYILSNRSRWVGDEEARLAQQDRMRNDLDELIEASGTDSAGSGPRSSSGAGSGAGAGTGRTSRRRRAAELFEAISASTLVEVSMPFAGEGIGWSTRIFPWEYALSAGDRASDRRAIEHPLTVVRHLDVATPALRRGASVDESLFPVLFLAEAPGRLARHMAFDVQRDLVWASLGCPTVDRFRPLSNPTEDQLRRAIREFSPQLIHVAGFDLHQGAALLGAPETPASTDGIFLPGRDHAPTTLDHVHLASTLCAANAPPRLIGFNLQRSASRMAAMSVAAGCSAAVGFHGQINDRLADLFFATLYGAGHVAHADLLSSFIEARTALGRQPREHRGTGVVLWGRQSWLKDPAGVPGSARRTLTDAGAIASPGAGTGTAAGTARPARVDAPRTTRSALEESVQPVPTATAPVLVDASGDRVSGGLGERTASEAPSRASESPLAVQIDVPERLNYAMLHNSRPLFRRFSIVNRSGAPIDRLVVDVSLHAGAETFPFRRMIWRHEGAPLELEREVRLPLVSPLWRAMREAVRTTLIVRVTCIRPDGTPLEAFLDTRQLTLLPPDEWRDDEDNRAWLPSFVLSRDPAVVTIVESAQRALMAITDDPGVGFDGYQRSLSAAGVDGVVDRQVRAIWHALLGDHAMSYINPPPTFSEQSQRLRRPAELLQIRRGTCIDLALLLAACLEFVNIHPVLFLLRNHALVGYWRSEAARTRFTRVEPPAALIATLTAGTRSASVEPTPPRAESVSAGTLREPEQEFPWMLGREEHAEILAAVVAGDLVALEAEALTRRIGFAAALIEGTTRVRNPATFEYFMDIHSARRRDVTPLPLDRWE